MGDGGFGFGSGHPVDVRVEEVGEAHGLEEGGDDGPNEGEDEEDVD